MADKSKIEWTDATWNPVRGCSLVSAGCTNCYAMKQAHRFSGPGGAYEGLTELGPHGPRWNGQVRVVSDLLTEPLTWKKPMRVFVNSMSDLFHEGVPDEFIVQVFNIMASATIDCGKRHKHEEECWTGEPHTFQILTKRPARMIEVLSRMGELACDTLAGDSPLVVSMEVGAWPLRNVHLGVSVEDQPTADKRVKLLMKTPAAVRFLSCEPLLGPIKFNRSHQYCPTHDFSGGFCSSPCPDQRFADWMIVGGESGPGARPCDLTWIRSIRDQCKAADVACFVKQLGAWPCEEDVKRKIILSNKKGGDWNEWPEDLRVREFPRNTL